MKSVCAVIELFNTSIGEIALLGFFDSWSPRPGMILKNSMNIQWKLTGVGMEKTTTVSSVSINKKFESVWDCRLEKNHNETLKVGELLYLED